MRTLQVNKHAWNGLWIVNFGCGVASIARSRYLFGMRIGEMAKQAGLNIQSIRFYERKGLLQEPPRTASGYRSYNERHLETIRFIKRGQSLGFTLHEVGQLLELHRSLEGSPLVVTRKKPSRSSERLVQLARERLNAIEEKIEILEHNRRSNSRDFFVSISRREGFACRREELSSPGNFPLDPLPKYRVDSRWESSAKERRVERKNSSLRMRWIGLIVVVLAVAMLAVWSVGTRAMRMQTAAGQVMTSN